MIEVWKVSRTLRTFRSIHKCTFARETTKSLISANGDRVAKSCSTQRFYKSYEEAEACALSDLLRIEEQLLNEVDRVRRCREKLINRRKEGKL
jgi:hypothetical protein